MTFLRRIRATAVLALAWALLWAPFGAAISMLLIGLSFRTMSFSLSLRDAMYGAAVGTLVGASWGLLSGAIFAATLAAVERRGEVEQLARRRVISWGALGGAAFPVNVTMVTMPLVGDDVSLYVPGLLALVGGGALYGALTAGGLLAAARSARQTKSS